jgi:cysteine desulfurase/selenocysteine lyase
VSENLINCKSDFPIFNNQNITYLDTASTSQKPQSVIDSIVEFYQSYNANVHRGLYPWAEKSTSNYENARNKIASHINALSSNLIFTKGTTESINFISNSWGENNVGKKDNIVITEMEHHSNIVPWQILSQKTGAELRYIPISDSGELILNNIDNIIDKNTKILSITHQSNVFGTVNPIKQIIAKAHNNGSVVLIDAAQSIAHQKIDVKDIDCDFLAFSGHKIMGPTGIGCLYVKDNLLNNLEPYQTGGQMIERVNKTQSTWNDIPFRFEAGTPNAEESPITPTILGVPASNRKGISFHVDCVLLTRSIICPPV